MENNLLKVFYESLGQVDTNEVLKAFNMAPTESNTVRVRYMLLSLRRYSFTDPESQNIVSGVTFTLTDGLTVQSDTASKGISIITFSITSDAVYKSFDKIPEPPIPVFCDIRIGKKSALKSIYTYQQVIEGGNS